MSIVSFFRKLLRVSIIKTLYINLKCLPFKQAKHLPIIIGPSVRLRSLSGKIVINCIPKFGLFQVSSHYAPVDRCNNDVVFFNCGEIIIDGPVYIRSGVTIWVNPTGHLHFKGENNVGANSIIISYKKLTFGYFSGVSWNCQVYDTNFHFFLDDTGEVISKRNGVVSIGDYVFIGNSCHITRGAKIPNYSVVSNRSVVDSSFLKDGEKILIAGHPAKVVAKGVTKAIGSHTLDYSVEEMLALKYDV